METERKKEKVASADVTVEDYIVLKIMQELCQKEQIAKAAFKKMVDSYGGKIDRNLFSCYAN